MTRLEKATASSVNLDRAGHPDWLDAAAEATRPGVSRNTPSACVNRGRLASSPVRASALAFIERGRWYYRGHALPALAETA